MTGSSRQTRALVQLADALAGYELITIDAVSARVLGKGDFFKRLKRGGDCRTETSERVLDWFDAVWPDDLDWACDLPRPSGRSEVAKLPRHNAQALADITNLPIWSSGRRPAWWHDIPVRSFLTDAHRQMSTLRAASLGAKRFGDRCPKKSSIHLYWQRLDKAFARMEVTK
ncbi:hypothetical protein [Antarcticimicrobium sediminis]|uniref:Uncharacterized protein n=1 Tax=Antarcticimicrobium sediminis TaxID=2546227 RepID=A0A4R5F1B9_9RHOB|nr:hypothetical protein [Antarcticimicrobium sediminis]TDE40960.1 hypothetical protein E1B25_01740 [Antarcticimicrobium sediminis]